MDYTYHPEKNPSDLESSAALTDSFIQGVLSGEVLSSQVKSGAARVFTIEL